MNVVITDEALDDLAKIGREIAKDNPTRSRTFLMELHDRCVQLAAMPRAYPLIPRKEQAGIRRRVYGNYLIFYRISDTTIEVLHVIHGARDYEKILFSDD